jgi:hypothetical protein
MSGNALLQDYNSHILTLPPLTDLEPCREANLRGLLPFTKVITETQECALGERA